VVAVLDALSTEADADSPAAPDMLLLLFAFWPLRELAGEPWWLDVHDEGTSSSSRRSASTAGILIRAVAALLSCCSSVCGEGKQQQ
jgi:hypothetical protein